MHILHLIRVVAPSHAEAEALAASTINDYGNENNWNSVCGSMKEDGSVHSTGEGGFDPVDYTLFTVKELAIDWCKGDKYNEEKFYKLVDLISSYKPVEDNLLWYFASKYCDHKLVLGKLDWQNFDPWTQEFRGDEFDENGITSYEPNKYNKIAFTAEEELSLAKYLVFIDTHK